MTKIEGDIKGDGIINYKVSYFARTCNSRRVPEKIIWNFIRRRKEIIIIETLAKNLIT